MLNTPTIVQLEGIKAALTLYIEATLSAYEAERGRFEVSKNRSVYSEALYDIYASILDRVLQEKSVTILPLTFKITAALISFGFNLELFLTLFVSTNEVIKAGYLQQGPKNIVIDQYLDSYVNEIVSSQQGLSYYLSGLTSQQQIQLIEQYGPSTVISDTVIPSSKVNLLSRHIYPLFNEELYWEVQEKKYLDVKYPTQRLAIYNDVLYRLNQGISRPSTGRFDSEEWGEFASKFLVKQNTFNNRLKINTEKYISEVFNKSASLNGIISDSSIKTIETDFIYDEKDLSISFAGKGNSIIKNILNLKETIKYFGNSEASPVGSIEYVASFAEYLYACNYSRVIDGGGFSIDGISVFGIFNLIFSYDFGVNKIAGLKFLESFKSLASFRQNTKIPELVQIKETENRTVELRYNPVYAKYTEGLKDRFVSYPKNVYVDSPGFSQESDNYVIDILLFGLESINSIANVLGDTVNSLDSGLGESGTIPGYEGYGPVSIQIAELATLFVPTNTIEQAAANGKVLPGFNGSTQALLNGYRKLTEIVPNVPLTGESLSYISIWARNVQKNLESIISDITAIGYLPGSFIPNISFKSSPKEQEILIDQLRSLNFQENEISQFLSVESFEEMVNKFAPVSDSVDEISFFKGYELSQLIYEFGGESAIDAYINYLYAPDKDGLINLLKISLKDQSEVSTYNQSRFGKLIGLLINLTFAIDPGQIEIFKEYLSGNFLNLFESISYLLTNNQANILKDKDAISLLEPVANSLIYGNSIFDLNSYNVNYNVVNRDAPVALQQMTKIIDKNLGNVATPLLQGLYDKSVGLTSKELVSILSPESQTTELGRILAGSEGGRLTKLINYAYLSGLVHKLSYYSNSYQVPNFFVSSTPVINLAVLVGTIQQLVFSIDLTVTNFVNALEYSTPLDTDTLYPFNNIANLYNKKIDSASYVVKNLIPINGDITNLGSPVASPDAEIIGSPGIGNSPVPESISKINSITPEQRDQFVPVIKTNFSFVANRKKSEYTESQIFEKFISLIKENKELNEVPSVNHLVVGESNYADVVTRTSKMTFSDPTYSSSLTTNNGINSQVETGTSTSTSTSTSTAIDNLEVNRNVPIASPRPAVNLFKQKEQTLALEGLIKQNLIEPFNPEESCGNFGGGKCKSRFADPQNTCGNPTNKAIYSERDTSPNTTIANGSVSVDRPYGSTIPNRVSKYFIPDGENNKPAYFNVFKDKPVSITDGGEPIFEEIFSEPIIFTRDNTPLSEDVSLEDKSSVNTGIGESVLFKPSVAFSTEENKNKNPELEKYYSSYYNSEFGLIEAIKANWERNDAFNCALLDDPYAYQACMNLLKCKRFERKDGVSSLRFCPRTLAGGLFK